MQNMQEIPGAGLSGQLPHSHIGELKCVPNTRENIPSELNVCKIRRKSQAADFPASYRTAI